MIAVLTDSTSDLSPEAAQQYGVQVIPLTVHLNGRDFLDWKEIDPDAVYDHLRNGGQASSSPPTPDQFESHYRRLLQTHDAVLSIHISSKLSDTVKHARQAAARLPDPSRVRIVDSLLAAAPLAEVTLNVQQYLNRAADLDGAEALIAKTRQALIANFSVTSLEYLRRNGRIGRAQELMGNLLDIRPVLNFEDGALQVSQRLKSTQILPHMLAQAEARFGRAPVAVTIANAGRDIARISALRAAVATSALNVQQGRALLLGPVIGAHVGPGAYGVMVRALEL